MGIGGVCRFFRVELMFIGVFAGSVCLGFRFVCGGGRVFLVGFCL